VIAGLLVDHQQTTFHQRQRGEADLSSGIRLPVGHRQRCPTARHSTSAQPAARDPNTTRRTRLVHRKAVVHKATSVTLASREKEPRWHPRRGQQRERNRPARTVFFPRVSDGIRTRDRRDHNPKDPVVSTRSLPCLLGFRPFELVPLVLRLVHELVHGTKRAGQDQDSSYCCSYVK
jgi:hypothetical protein